MNRFTWEEDDVTITSATKAFSWCDTCVAIKACAEPIQGDDGRFIGCKRGSGKGGSSSGAAADYKDTRKDWDAADAYDQLSKEIGLRKGRQTEEEIDSVKEYTTRQYKRINGALRDSQGDLSKVADPDELATIQNIDSVLSKTSVKHNMVVHRGAEFDSRVVVGAKITDHAFVSTSTMESTAEGFAQYSRSSIYHIKVPVGAKASFVAPKSDKPQEQEVLLPRGLTYKVVNISHRSPYRSDVDLEILNGQ